jgi:drug/metabolite transporter (DMT)-like permease
MGSAVNGYIFALITAVVIIVADILLKIAADRGQPVHHYLVVIGCLLYFVSAIMWYMSMQHVGLAQAGIAYSMFSLLILAAIGHFWFGEQLGIRELGGIGCALLAMVLMVRVA